MRAGKVGAEREGERGRGELPKALVLKPSLRVGRALGPPTPRLVWGF